MKGNDQALDQLLGLIEVASQMAAELSAQSEAREELIGALAVATFAGLRLAAEHRANRRAGRR